MARYYDIVLGLIPLALGGTAAVFLAAGFALTTAVPPRDVRQRAGRIRRRRHPDGGRDDRIPVGRLILSDTSP